MFIVLRKLGWFFWEHRWRYGLALSLLMVLNFTEVIPPSLIGRTIDALTQGTLTGVKLLQTVVLYGAITAVTYGFGVTWMLQLFGGANLLQKSFRTRLFQHFLRMTPTFYERNRTGDLMALATNDLNAVSQTAGFGILTLVDSTTFAGTIVLTMGLFISWKLTCLALLPLPLVAFSMTKFGKIIHERFLVAQASFGDMNDRVLDSVTGIRVIRAYVQERAQERRFAATTADVYQKNVAVARIDALFEPTNKLLIGITYLIGLGYGSYMVFQSQITLGQLASFNVYLGMLIWPMLAVGELINIMQRGNASLDRVNDTLSYRPDVHDASPCQSIGVVQNIEFRHVTFRYPQSSADSLRDISLTLQRGETLGIVGRTGSGKSTLIKQILREYPAGKGTLLMNGIPLTDIAMASVHQGLGYVPQDAMLFSRTIEQNVKFGAPEATAAAVLAALHMAGFTKDLDVLPEGLQTLVGEKGVSLSGGQKQRVALARALILDPPLLILDDAMSAVDARTEAHIIEAIRGSRKDRTTIIATHRLSAVQHAHWIVVLDDGRIVEQGTHDTLVALDGWYREQFDRQQVEEGSTTALEGGVVR